MTHSTKGAGSPVYRPAPSKWIFTKEQMKNTANRKEGMSREEELGYRQLAAAFIQEMVDGLNNVKDPKMKIGHTGLCVAHTHMHRFYYWHSFKKYDYRDVGAACVFVAGKSHECPRKLSHVVGVWRDRKDRKQLTTEAARNEAAQIIVLLESMILQTIAFDLNIHLPHVNVLQIMEKVDKDEHYRSLKSCAFYFATDVIAVTDWCLRYSAASMSIVIIHLMAAYANVRIERLFADFMTEGSPWYAQFDETMNEDKLREMERDFIQTYRNSCQFHYASKYNLRENRPPLDHPDVRKIERTRDARSHSPMINHQQVPDSTQNGRPRGYVPKDELTVERLNKERLVEEERRKRDHDRMAGRIDNSTSSEKRARIDPLSNNFVTSSSMTSSVSNGKLLPPPPIPPQLNYPPPPIGGYSTNNQQKNQMSRRPFEQMTTTSSGSPAFRASARAFDVAPMLTPPVAPKLQNLSDSDMDLEDGEVE
ncbi:hypothetical protein GCK72_008237 [Caenorhabditis remanei]|uniref:Cyclin N-terminal domain-containing protein n=1 Tax=Caenorhabditis remanei TaxID=31234 RepID=A0A6A5H0G7_CAERE|nr:hypothetical protein GCK72_008237 [Caenorhabditis remanei]KAF1759992.1 hypothetical protein GCK72_008237 [Caenorhabditis remanei]